MLPALSGLNTAGLLGSRLSGLKEWLTDAITNIDLHPNSTFQRSGITEAMRATWARTKVFALANVDRIAELLLTKGRPTSREQVWAETNGPAGFQVGFSETKDGREKHYNVDVVVEEGKEGIIGLNEQVDEGCPVQ